MRWLIDTHGLAKVKALFGRVAYPDPPAASRAAFLGVFGMTLEEAETRGVPRQLAADSLAGNASQAATGARNSQGRRTRSISGACSRASAASGVRSAAGSAGSHDQIAAAAAAAKPIAAMPAARCATAIGRAAIRAAPGEPALAPSTRQRRTEGSALHPDARS